MDTQTDTIAETVAGLSQGAARQAGILAELLAPENLMALAGILARMLVVVLIVMIIRRILLSLIDRVMRNKLTERITEKSSMLEENRLRTIQKLAKSIVSYSLYFIAIITCLDMVNVKVTTILAGAGILSLAVAFGAQSIVQDLMSGLFVILENQYAVGEYVKIGSTVGRVEEIGMKTTKIATYNGEIMIIPNGQISQVVNYSRRAQRGTVDVGIAYEADIDQAAAVLAQACEAVSETFGEVLDERCNVLGVVDLADSSVVLRLTFTAYEWKQLAVERALRKGAKEALDAAGIEIAYPKVQLVGGETTSGGDTSCP